jgi:hypothetical protein
MRALENRRRPLLFYAQVNHLCADDIKSHRMPPGVQKTQGRRGPSPTGNEMGSGTWPRQGVYPCRSFMDCSTNDPVTTARLRTADGLAFLTNPASTASRPAAEPNPDSLCPRSHQSYLSIQPPAHVCTPRLNKCLHYAVGLRGRGQVLAGLMRIGLIQIVNRRCMLPACVMHHRAVIDMLTDSPESSYSRRIHTRCMTQAG